MLVGMKVTSAQKVQIFCAALSATAITRNDGDGTKRGFDNAPVEEALKLMKQAVDRLEADPDTPDTTVDYRRPIVDI